MIRGSQIMLVPIVTEFISCLSRVKENKHIKLSLANPLPYNFPFNVAQCIQLSYLFIFCNLKRSNILKFTYFTIKKKKPNTFTK
ncbi:hypothetical protein FKM82_001000 [Ascaphus truei]